MRKFKILKIGAILIAVAVLAFAPSPASADITFPVDITGFVYVDGAPPAPVNCRGREGNTITFVNGDVSVNTLPIITMDSTCELHTSQGVFTGGEVFSGELLDETVMASNVTNRTGAEIYQMVLILETQTSGPGNVELVLDYLARFGVDKSIGMLQPPLKSIRGNLRMMNDSTGETFIGLIKTTGKPF
ncbi:MAG: hypothetical protein Q8R92_12425 [Deltaproteobacteria bacterium]|nr:hypothetical protein [Deltaproteobacteria bacterium]